MFSHVMRGVNDLEVSKRFYDALLGTLGIGQGVANKNRYFYRSPTGIFGITTPINGGTSCEDPPGFRDGAVGKLYIAYVRDPDGNKICALQRPVSI